MLFSCLGKNSRMGGLSKTTLPHTNKSEHAMEHENFDGFRENALKIMLDKSIR